MIMNNIKDKIGLPALLEGTAEEAMEFAHICLKYARKLRDENPTPMMLSDIRSNFHEELADLTLYIDELWNANELDSQVVEEIFDKKLKRWHERIDKMKSEREMKKGE